MDGAEGHVEEDGLVGGETDQALQDDGTEDGRHGGAGVDADDHGHVEPVSRLRPGLQDLLEVEFVRDDTLLVGLESVDGLETVLGRQVASFSGTVLGPEVCDGADADGQESEEEVDDLVFVEGGGVDAAETVYDGRADQCAEAVAAVPGCDAERLLRASVEGNGDHGEERDDGSLKGTQEESRHEEASVVARRPETSSD